MTTIQPGYALEQLRRALATQSDHADEATRQRAGERVRRWHDALTGMLAGSLAVGSRTPVANTPAWVTLEVATGGFATGGLLAGGELRAHEHELLARLGGPGALAPRAALNVYFLGDEGRAELTARLADGRYRLDVPEEGALLVVTWLLDRGETERAQEVLDAIAPWMDRLRFYPVLDERPRPAGGVVNLQTVGETRTRLTSRQVPAQVARMNVALTVWNPLRDRALALFTALVEGRPDVPPEPGWLAQASALRDAFVQAEQRHPTPRRLTRPGETMQRLRAWLDMAVQNPPALVAQSPRIRRLLEASARRRGAPGSTTLAERQRAGAEQAARPTYPQIAHVVARRLAGQPADQGLERLDEACAPLDAGEAAQLGVGAGFPLPAAIVAQVERSLEAPVETLVARRLVRSSEALARLLPQLTAAVRSTSFDDPAAGRLYAALYASFRRRRSLLLLNLASQVRITELPWVRALESLRTGGASQAVVARRALEQVASLALGAFPQTIVPNKLVQELGALVKDANAPVPLVEELAVDIFMGAFSPTFTEAARMAADLLAGSLYERYYGLPFDRVRRLPAAPSGSSPSAGFAALCTELAAPRTQGVQRFTVRNGMILEVEQLLTTHNLASLFAGLDLGRVLGDRLVELGQQCFTWCARQLPRPAGQRRSELHRRKNVAYAWRQMVFFLSLAGEAAHEPFLAWARDHLARRPGAVQASLAPALDGLTRAVRRQPAEPLLAWQVARLSTPSIHGGAS